MTQDPTLTALHAACVAAPNNTELRLVYADALEESDDPSDQRYGRFVRLQCLQAERAGKGDPECEYCEGTGILFRSRRQGESEYRNQVCGCVEGYHARIEKEIDGLWWPNPPVLPPECVSTRLLKFNAGLGIPELNEIVPYHKPVISNIRHFEVRRGMIEKAVVPSVAWWLGRGTVPSVAWWLGRCTVDGWGRILVNSHPILEVRPLDVELHGSVGVYVSPRSSFYERSRLGRVEDGMLPWDAAERSRELTSRGQHERPDSCRYWLGGPGITFLTYQLPADVRAEMPDCEMAGMDDPARPWEWLSKCLIGMVSNPDKH